MTNYDNWWTTPPETGREMAHQRCLKCGEMEECIVEYGICVECEEVLEAWEDDCRIEDYKERSR